MRAESCQGPDCRGARTGRRIAAVGALINLILAAVKLTAGFVGHSTALLADGVESLTDVFSSLVVYGGLRMASRPPDRSHPYGHGKAESMAALVAALFLLVAAVSVAWQGIRELLAPSPMPRPFTLAVLAGVIVVKETLHQTMRRAGRRLGSRSLEGDAWHHRSDVLTSLVAFAGVAATLWGGEALAWADDGAALLACGIILVNGIRLIRPAVDEVMDASAPQRIESAVRSVAGGIEGVVNIEKCRIRKAGLGYQMDIHVQVEGEITVRAGHSIGHRVKEALLDCELPVSDVIVHVEPGPD